MYENPEHPPMDEVLHDVRSREWNPDQKEN
jgi:hypothetical protein